MNFCVWEWWKRRQAAKEEEWDRIEGGKKGLVEKDGWRRYVTSDQKAGSHRSNDVWVWLKFIYCHVSEPKEGYTHIWLIQITQTNTHTFVPVCSDCFGSPTRGLSEIPLPILWCRQTLETKPVSSTWQVRGQVSSSFMVSILSSKPDIEPVGEWRKCRVWLTCCLLSDNRATLSSLWKWCYKIVCDLVCKVSGLALQLSHFIFSLKVLCVISSVNS